ncbi:MAG: DsrE/DsrF/DrsH-like family protein [Chloroflexi bacterium]|nr:DsrE/DsrF/DrsH-like family protein [Chloroflexota bacterium]MBI3732602.1 DsrE/DsrF/DrsH-like family protein [Chloroflexota bacterium]
MVNDLVAKKLAAIEEEKQNRPRRLALIASKGSLDWAYPPMILASTAGAMGWEVGVFFTFYGLPLLVKNGSPAVTPLGNPAMPMKMPFGPDFFQNVNWPIPTAMMALPGFGALATSLMKQSFKNHGVASIGELRDACVETGVNLIACQMTMEVFGFRREDFIDECTVGGAATFLEYASHADVQLFI